MTAAVAPTASATAGRPVEALLDRLEAVRETGPRRWLARCPAHDDTTPILSIRELDGGTVLVHDFGAGCGGAEVVVAVGLELRDLFPARSDDHQRRPTRPGERWVPRDVIRALADEVLVVLVAAEDTAAGKALAEADRQRIAVAESPIRAAVREVRDHA